MLGNAHNNYTHTLYNIFRELFVRARAQNEPLRSQLIEQIVDFHDAYLPAILRYLNYGHRQGPKSLPALIQADQTFSFLNMTPGGVSVRQRMVDELTGGVPDEPLGEP